MSSLVRRIEKSIMKRAGFEREKFRVGKNSDGSPRLINVRRGGVITDLNDDPIGYHWPSRVPASAIPPKRKTKRVVQAARGQRRGRSNKTRNVDHPAPVALKGPRDHDA